MSVSMATAEPPKPSWGCRYENVALGEEKKIKWQNNISVSESHISRLNNQTRHTTTSVFKVLWNQELCSWFFTRLWHQEMSSGQWLPVKPGDGFWNTCRVVGIKNNLQITIIYILTQHFLMFSRFASHSYLLLFWRRRSLNRAGDWYSLSC